MAQATVSGSTVVRNEGHGISVRDTGGITLVDSTIKGNQNKGIEVLHAVQATIAGSTVVGNHGHGILIANSAHVTIDQTMIRDSWEYGIFLDERPWLYADWVFTGYVAGKANTRRGHADGDAWPDGLDFLFSVEGCTLDRRK